jgi:hypothetical protein
MTEATLMTDSRSPTLSERTLTLKHWFIDAFRDADDSDDIEYGLSKLAKGKPDPENTDDHYLLRILQHLSIPTEHVYTLLALLLRRRGGSVPDVSPPNEDLLARAVRKLSHSSPNGLHVCMMAFTALFPSSEDDAGYLAGGINATKQLLQTDDEGKRVALDLTLSLHRRFGKAKGSSEILSAVMDKVADHLLNTDDIRGGISFHETVSPDPVFSLSEVSERFHAKGMDFFLLYRSIVADYERRQEEETMAEAEGIVRRLGWDRVNSPNEGREDEELEEVVEAARAAATSRTESEDMISQLHEMAAQVNARTVELLAEDDVGEDGNLAAGADERNKLVGGTLGSSSGQDEAREATAETAAAGDGVDVVMVDEGGGNAVESAVGFEQKVSGADDGDVGGEDDTQHEALQAGDETRELVPITQTELDDILRERYRWGRSHKKGKDGEDMFGKELKKSKAHPGWTDAARQTRDTWVRLEEELPGTYCLWKLGDTIGKLVVKFNQKGQSKSSASTVYKNISVFLNSNLTDVEKRKYFGSIQTFEDCLLILKTAWKGVNEALADAVKNSEYSEKERGVPAWPVICDMAQNYINGTAAPLRIETAEHLKLVRRLYGLRVTITEHVPRRREVFKVTPLRLTRLDPSHEDYVNPRECNYVDESGVLRLNVYKTADLYREYAMQLSPAAHGLVLLLEDYAERENQKTLFGNENNLSNLLYDIYEPVLRVRVGCGALRRRYISHAVHEGRLRKQRDQVELSRKMGHSVWMQLFYYAKEESFLTETPTNPSGTERQSERPPVPSGEASEPIVLDSEPEDIPSMPDVSSASSSPSTSRKRQGNTDRSPPTKRMKQRQYQNPLQTAALRDIILKEREEGWDGSKIAWNRYVALYPALQGVDGDTIRRWGNSVRNEIDGKKPSPSRGNHGNHGKGKEAEKETTIEEGVDDQGNGQNL